MDPNWEERLETLRPELIAQQSRLRHLVETALDAVRTGRTDPHTLAALAAGEEHPLLGINVGRDYLMDSLLAAWEMHATGRTVEDVIAEIRTRQADGTLLPVGRSVDETNALALVPHVSTLQARITMWDGCTPEEYVELARTWIRTEQETNEDVPEPFEAFARAQEVSDVDAVRAGLVLLTWLEDLLTASASAALG